MVLCVLCLSSAAGPQMGMGNGDPEQGGAFATGKITLGDASAEPFDHLSGLAGENAMLIQFLSVHSFITSLARHSARSRALGFIGY